MNADLINGLFEFAGAAMLAANTARLWKDRELKGVSWLPTLFFTAWGLWNVLFYYPQLNQWFSWAGGVCIVVVNTIWLSLLFYFSRKRKSA